MFLTELISQIEISCDCLYYNWEMIVAFTISLRSSCIMDAITQNPQYNMIDIAFKKLNMTSQDINYTNIRCTFSSNQKFRKLSITFAEKESTQIQMSFMNTWAKLRHQLLTPRKIYIRMNNNKIDSIETGRIVIAHLLP